MMEKAAKENDPSALVVALKTQLQNVSSDSEVLIMLDDKNALELTKELLQRALVVVNSQLVELNKQNATTQATCGGDAILEMKNIQCFEPRGRFDLKITTSHIVLEGKQFSVLIPVNFVEQIICLPSFTSAKKEGEDYLAIQLNSPVKVNNKDSTQVLLNLSRSVNPTTRSALGDNDVSESAIVVMSIQDATGKHVEREKSSLFSTCRDQKPFLKCYRGTQEGAIYPLQCGVVFIKPLLVIPADKIASLSAGRGGGAGNTRYVDLMIESTEDKTHEFTNIDREELPALQLYVKGYLEARAARLQKAQIKSERKLKEEIQLDDGDDDRMDVVGDIGGHLQAEKDLYESDSSDEDDEDYNDSDSDDDDSDDSGSDNSGDDSAEDDSAEEDSDCSEARTKHPKKSASKTLNSKKKAKKIVADEELDEVHKSEKTSKTSAVPGQSVARAIPPVTMYTGGLIHPKSEQQQDAQQTKRKKAVPVKREIRDNSNKSSRNDKSDTKKSIIKAEPAPISLDMDEYPPVGEGGSCHSPVRVKAEVYHSTVVDAAPALASASEVIDISSPSKNDSIRASSAISSKESSGVGKEVSVPSSSVGTKRTIMDMFKVQQKPTVAVADLTDA